MECNKDEAFRAREIAEKKMSSNDFQGAKKIALKAQNLYPELDNISQLLNVCDVHCSAQQGNLGSEKDWYGILQVDRMADQMTIKKQYRRLALVLHPDKNRFPGAEAAFKLISEAHAILSDSAKKSVYDSKIRVLGRSAPVNPPPQHASYQFNKQTVNGTSGSKQSEVFWTRCPLCNTTYQYPRAVVNRVLKCPKCSKPFIGTEVNPQSVPSGKWTHLPSRSGSSQPAAFHEKVVPEPSSFNMNVQNGKGPPAPQARSTGVASKIPVQPGPGFQAGGGSKAVPAAGTFKEYLKANSTKANSSRGFNEGEKPNDVAVNKESRNSKNKSMKTGKNRVVESSDDSDTTTGSRFKGVTSNTPATDLKSGPCQVPLQRKSSRRKQNVSYNEGDDDDFSTPPKRSKTSPNREDDLEEQKVGPDSESLKDGGEGDAESKSKEGTVLPEGKLRKKGPSEIVDVSDSDNDDSENVKLEFPDPEFNDFEKERDESCFKVDQYWACYDSFDGMPRFYARVQKVSTSPFEVSFRWLEAMPIDEEFEDWVEEDMPVSCGTFKLGKPDKVSERVTFSHEVKNITKVTKSKKRGTLFIYPEKSEIWAIFKDWDMSWSAEPENHKKPKYEIVEVLSDFDEGTGVRVGYLDKVQGFVSLFQRASESEDDSFVIKPSELYKFSHKILSFKMSGSEREGVPKGSFELDPASLPENPNDLHFPVKAKVQQSGTVPGVYPSTPLSKKGKSVDEVPMVRRSPRGLNLGR